MAEAKKKEAAVKEEPKEKEEEKHYIVLTDDKGKDTKVELLFSIVYHKTEQTYLYVVDPTDEDSVIIFKGDDEGNLEAVDENSLDAETKAFLMDTFQAYLQGDLTPVNEEGKDGDEEDECDDPDCDCHHHHEEGECCCGDEKDGDCCCSGEKEDKDEDCCCGGKDDEKDECCCDKKKAK